MCTTDEKIKESYNRIHSRMMDDAVLHASRLFPYCAIFSQTDILDHTLQAVRRRFFHLSSVFFARELVTYTNSCKFS